MNTNRCCLSWYPPWCTLVGKYLLFLKSLIQSKSWSTKLKNHFELHVHFVGGKNLHFISYSRIVVFFANYRVYSSLGLLSSILNESFKIFVLPNENTRILWIDSVVTSILPFWRKIFFVVGLNLSWSKLLNVADTSIILIFKRHQNKYVLHNIFEYHWNIWLLLTRL